MDNEVHRASGGRSEDAPPDPEMAKDGSIGIGGLWTEHHKGMKLKGGMMQDISVRLAQRSDASAISDIYNEGIEDRAATFETRQRTASDVESWFDGRHPVVVCTCGGKVAAFAATSTYRDRACYAGIAEFSVYVARAYRSHGLGRIAMEKLIKEAEKAGFWKLISRIFPENTASRHLVASVGFREVGVYEKHGKLDGEWKDVVIVERLIDANSVN